MPFQTLFAALLCLFSLPLVAGEKPASTPQPVMLTFYIVGMECSACTDFVNQAIYQIKPSVKEVQPDEFGVLNISFDPNVLTPHQIAQAVSEALPLHGKPYEATLKFRVPDYAKGDNAAKLDALFAQWKDFVKVELDDKAKGEFILHFLPLKTDKTKPGRQGWSPDQLASAVQEPAPRGLGLQFTLLKQGAALESK